MRLGGRFASHSDRHTPADARTIVFQRSPTEPGSRILTPVEIAKSQDAEVGDGTTSVVLLAAEILKQMKPFIEEGVHPHIIIKSLRKGLSLLLNHIREISIKFDKTNDKELRSTLKKCATTTLSSKLVASSSDFFLMLDELLPLNMIGIKKVQGGALEESQPVAGVAFKKTFSYAGFEMQPKRIEDVKIALINIELELRAEKTVELFRVIVPMAAEGGSSTASEPQDVLGQYELWKKNVPFIYDVCIAHALEWPSLTVQLMPNVTTHRDRGCEVHRAILGTHTNEQENYLLIAEITMHKEFDKVPTSAEPAEVGFSLTANKIDIKKRIYHEGEVNRARYMPQKPTTVATKTPGADVLIFDTDKFLDPLAEEKVLRPTLRLKGHTKEGYGLALNPQKTGHLLSASDDCTICLWDINERTQANGKFQAMTIFRFHTDVVEDVTWHTMHDTLFASVSDDRMLCLWDTRSKEVKPSQSVAASDKEEHAALFGSAARAVAAQPVGGMRLSDQPPTLRG